MTRRYRESDFDTYTLRLPHWATASSERVDRFVVRLAVFVVVLAVPIAGATGVAVYNVNRDAYLRQAESRHNIAATVTTDAVKPDLRRNVVRVPVEWAWNGTRHTGTLRVSPGVRPGDTVDIWVDENGSMVSAPKSTTTAMLDGVVVAAAVWLTVAGGAAIAVAARTSRTHSGWPPTQSAPAP